MRLGRTLLEADKGLPFWPRDADGDIKPKLAPSEGFEHDPPTSTIEHRFAEAALERDQTVREANPWEVEAGQRTEADEEIENLVVVPIYLQDEFNSGVACAKNSAGFHDYPREVLLSVGDHASIVLQNARLQGSYAPHTWRPWPRWPTP
jgi:GAF domain-containing protein